MLIRPDLVCRQNAPSGHRGGTLWATDARPEALGPCTSGALPPRRPMAASVVSPGQSGNRQEPRQGGGERGVSASGWCSVSQGRRRTAGGPRGVSPLLERRNGQGGSALARGRAGVRVLRLLRPRTLGHRRAQ